ncbi:methyltransferase-domain-containing protein [Lipomyces oligophaga]|uniref:methyltransferase-domain-containing protein n=1 Tax=Lipomyces oligophaga TaxID=45792 RepID=UPI0034CD5920
MSLFEIEGWKVSTPIADHELQKRGGNKRSWPEGKKRKRQDRDRKGHNHLHETEDGVEAIERDTLEHEEDREDRVRRKLSSQELQKLFESQFKKDDPKAERKHSGAQKEKKQSRQTVQADEYRNEKKQRGKDKSKNKTKDRGQEMKSSPDKKPNKSEVESNLPSSAMANGEAQNAAKLPSQIPPKTKLTPLQAKMRAKLSGSRFRWINEQLYTTSSQTAAQLISKQPELYDEYHSGFRQQIQSWPSNPVDVFIAQIKNRAKLRPGKHIQPGTTDAVSYGIQRDRDGSCVIADMGCGDAELAKQVSGSKAGKNVKITVHSFDLAKTNERVTVADVRNVPLKDSSVHIVVFCLSLMGTNFVDFIKEAARIVKPRGQLWIAEIKSRFPEGDYSRFIATVKRSGFLLTETDDSNTMFVRFEFYKPLSEIKEKKAIEQGAAEATAGRKKLKFIDSEDEDEQEDGDETLILKPCLYKKR